MQPAETKRNLKALKSVPISFNSLGLDTAFSGSFNGIGDSPAANAAGSDSAISAVPERKLPAFRYYASKENRVNLLLCSSQAP